jgi:camelysin-like metallo-endopeptidase
VNTLKAKLLMTLLVVGAVGSVAGFGAFSAFSSQTTNAANSFAAGTVNLTDNDSGAAMYSVSNRKPGQSVQQCIKLTYDGTLPADVKLYTLSTINALGSYVDLTVEKGTATGATFPGCGTFTSESTVYTGTLGAFATAKNSYANGVAAFPASQTQWNQTDTLVYRFTLTLQDDNNANGGAGPLSSGNHTFTFEARNQ